MNAIKTLAAGVVLALLGTAGCSGGSATATGAVSYGGQPLQNGSVTFLPAGDKQKKVGAQVVDGKYAVDPDAGLAPGSYKVEIHWRKPTGKKYKSDAGEFDVVEEGLPAKYHEATTLTADVKAGANVIDFNLAK